jgi:hypothetical protein
MSATNQTKISGAWPKFVGWGSLDLIRGSHVVGMARCAVPVAERSVRRRKRGAETRVLARVPHSASLRAGTAQRAVPSTIKNRVKLPLLSGGFSGFILGALGGLAVPPRVSFPVGDCSSPELAIAESTRQNYTLTIPV